MIPVIVLGLLLLAEKVLFERERASWRKERTFLTNTAIARTQSEFAVRTAAVAKAEAPAAPSRPTPIASLSDLPEDLREGGAVTSLPIGL